ncbi:MAG TPA: prepilin peptidase [Rhizomicrobium sp.]|jgi:leader peptidase (prepilin peptidase)/N-methyltransferase|nr:prepilin peptidase [Rhizomicrobium sp.]
MTGQLDDTTIFWPLVVVAPFIGSFLGVLTHRLIDGRPIATGRSACDSCGKTLEPLDLVPIVSWLALRARCRHCHARISAFYPAIELASVLVVLWGATRMVGNTLIATTILGWLLLTIAIIGWRRKTAPVVAPLSFVIWLVWLYGPALYGWAQTHSAN